jgi:CRP-like cAMP-binding protein
MPQDSTPPISAFDLQTLDRAALRHCILFNGRPQANPAVGVQLSDKVMDALYGCAKPRDYKPGTPIVYQGATDDVVGVIVYGYAAVARQVRTQVKHRSPLMHLYNIGPHEAFGITQLADRKPHYAEVIATTPTRVLRLQSNDILDTVAGQGRAALGFYTNLSVYLALKFKRRGARLSSQYRKYPEVRVQEALLEISDNHAALRAFAEKHIPDLKVPERPSFELDLLSSWIGLTRKQIENYLRQYRNSEPPIWEYENVGGSLVLQILNRPELRPDP